MFTGLIEQIGVLRSRAGGRTARAFIEAEMGPLKLGESIAVHGACLTVDAIRQGGFEVDMSKETLEKTTLGEAPVGRRLHLERALTLSKPLDGHIVLGHVDGIGRVESLSAAGDARRLRVRAPASLAAFVAPKGSVAVDGVSLTVNAVTDAEEDFLFEVMLVPHTLERTELGGVSAGQKVNLEVDPLARYVVRALERRARERASSGGPAQNSDGADADRTNDDARMLDKLARGGFL